jgi:DNA invertase Pin-like site-specific DNA recombinase
MTRAKAAGKKIGRPPVNAATRSRIEAVLRAGDSSVREIARRLRVATVTVQRVKRELAA